jgi:cell division protein FtsI (penicillin-binding protein 3)
MEKTGKILAIFLLIFLFFVVFISGVVGTITQPTHQRSYYKTENLPAFRGAIVSKDGHTLASSSSHWQLVFDGRHAHDEKKPLLAALLARYLDQNEEHLLGLLLRNQRVLLAKELTTTQAQALKSLSRALDKKGVFRTLDVGGNKIRYGLEVTPHQPARRNYLYEEMAQPVLGYVQKSSGQGEMGLERFYESSLKAQRAGALYGQRDAGGNLIYNNRLDQTRPKHGATLMLTLDLALQGRIEALLDAQAEVFEASEVIAGVMESTTGRLVALASSNRYNPNQITGESLANTRMNVIQYPFEPGSVMKPFILSLLFEEGSAGQYDLVRGYNGRLELGNEVIEDDFPRAWLSAEDVIVYSSNVGIAQLALGLSAYKMHDGLSRFGFAKSTGIDLPYEAVGDLPGIHRYRTDIYRATTGYGYGLRTTFMQLLKGYNIFNNNGIAIAPHLVERMGGEFDPLALPPKVPERILTEATAMKMMQILRKVVLKGTGKNAQVEGIFTAGKTGTARIAFSGGYSDTHHSSFFGFANDETNRYTIGVLFIDPKKEDMAARTAAPTFKEIVEILRANEYLHTAEPTDSDQP